MPADNSFGGWYDTGSDVDVGNTTARPTGWSGPRRAATGRTSPSATA
ncbi:hypothetical protein ACIOKD_36670 [Streptomyces sp. NPDC087844]